MTKECKKQVKLESAPEWFDNDKYLGVSELSFSDWFRLIDTRNSALQFIKRSDSLEETCALNRIYNRRFQSNPLDCSIGDDWPWFGDEIDKQERFNYKKNSSILPIKRPNQSMLVYADSAEVKKKLNAERDEISELYDFYYTVDVDLSAPESKIKADFEKWLKLVKGIRSKRLENFRLSHVEPKFASLHAAVKSLILHRVLQYFDLYIFFISIGCSTSQITDYQMGKIIFPGLEPNDAQKKIRDHSRRIFEQIIDCRNAYLEAFKSLL